MLCSFINVYVEMRSDASNAGIRSAASYKRGVHFGNGGVEDSALQHSLTKDINDDIRHENSTSNPLSPIYNIPKNMQASTWPTPLAFCYNVHLAVTRRRSTNSLLYIPNAHRKSAGPDTGFSTVDSTS
jgi:hypothetical protein